MESKTQGSLWALQEPQVCKNLGPKCKSIHGSHWWLLRLANNGWKRELDDIDTSIFKFFSKLYNPFLYI